MIPGILLAIALMIYVAFISKRRNYPRGNQRGRKAYLRYVLTSLPALLTPVILLLGIYTGVATVTEAGALAGLYALVVAFFAYLSRCGHGDKILIADGSYPLASKTGNAQKVYLGVSAEIPSIIEVLTAVLQEVPVEKAEYMVRTDGSSPPILNEFQNLLPAVEFAGLSRFPFYELCSSSLLLAISTGEKRAYTNIILTVGVA